MSFSSSSELWLLRSAAIVSFVRSFVRVLDQILPIEGRLGGGNKYGERGSCGRDGRKEGSRGGVGTYKRTSVLLSYEQRAVLSRALERRKKKIRALHMLTPKGEASMRRLGRALSASACTRRVECLAICPRPPPVLWFLSLSLTTSVHQLHFFCCFRCGPSSSGSPGKKTIFDVSYTLETPLLASQPDVRCSEITPKPECAERAAISRFYAWASRAAVSRTG